MCIGHLRRSEKQSVAFLSSGHWSARLVWPTQQVLTLWTSMHPDRDCRVAHSNLAARENRARCVENCSLRRVALPRRLRPRTPPSGCTSSSCMVRLTQSRCNRLRRGSKSCLPGNPNSGAYLTPPEKLAKRHGRLRNEGTGHAKTAKRIWTRRVRPRLLVKQIGRRHRPLTFPSTTLLQQLRARPLMLMPPLTPTLAMTVSCCVALLLRWPQTRLPRPLRPRRPRSGVPLLPFNRGFEEHSLGRWRRLRRRSLISNGVLLEWSCNSTFCVTKLIKLAHG
mmetsp:Transcript_7850/g.24495  ORF Transcript_7850/g.24495 Transcript_7850/m.24495 type:complete len:279 (-) Transcript_7850:337-1173(-)